MASRAATRIEVGWTDIGMLSPDGSLVTVESDGAVRVYAVPGGAERFAFRPARRVTGLAFSPDGRTLAAASSDVPVTLWDVTGGKL